MILHFLPIIRKAHGDLVLCVEHERRRRRERDALVRRAEQDVEFRYLLFLESLRDGLCVRGRQRREDRPCGQQPGVEEVGRDPGFIFWNVNGVGVGLVP